MTITLRQWCDDDLRPLIEMNRHPEVMRYFPRQLTEEESSLQMVRCRERIENRGWGLWVVDVDGHFAGFAGLEQPSFSSHFTPCVEIGWRLRAEYWGRSIAFEAARKALEFARTALELDQIVSFTSVENWRSRRLMERLEFQHNPADDFWHPNLPSEHPLARHVLYRKDLLANAGGGLD